MKGNISSSLKKQLENQKMSCSNFKVANYRTNLLSLEYKLQNSKNNKHCKINNYKNIFITKILDYILYYTVIKK